jgi:hypothetical protein
VQLTGTLATFPLRELIEMTVYSSVTGVLEVRIGDDLGQLFFHDGRPYHAVADSCIGFEAVCRIFEERDAMFRFVAGRTVVDETLWMDPWEMIERAEHQAQLWLRVRPHIPSLAWVPTLRSSTSADHIHIGEGVWPVLSAVDGQRNVQAIAEALSIAPLDVCSALVSLLEQGLISIRQPLPTPLEPRPFPPQKRPDASRPAPGFFDRLLAEAQAQEETQIAPTDGDQQDQEQPQVHRYVNNRYLNSR